MYALNDRIEVYPAICHGTPLTLQNCNDRTRVKDAAIAFVAFCLESYKTRHALSGDESAKIFGRYGVGNYLLEGYDILHSFGERQILDDIDRFIEVRRQKEAQ